MEQLTSQIGNTDIYLLDQIIKGRYEPTDVMLDAGAGGGRNLHWFVQQGIMVYGVDRDASAVTAMKQNYPSVPEDHFLVAPVESMPFPNGYFNHIISSAVLHFAENQAHFEQMFEEMVRVLKPGGSLFIRATTDVGLDGHQIPLGNGRFHLSDGSDRFIVTKPAVEALMQRHGLRWLEPFKSVVVDGARSMGVLVLGKSISSKIPE